MKPVTLAILLAVSLVVNGVLVSKLKTGRGETTLASEAASATTTSLPDAEPNGKKVTEGKTVAPAAAVPAKLHGVDWAALSAGGDLATLVARMRAAGYPGLIVHAVVWAELTHRFAEQRSKLTPQADLLAYWKNPMLALADPERMAAMREISREHNRLMKELLGPDYQRQNAFLSFTERRQFGDLPREKTEEIKQIMQDYTDLTARVRLESQNMLLREDREKLAYLEQEKMKDIQKALTPEQYEDYMLRSSSTAQQLRFQLANFEPTEQEYRAIFKAQSEFDTKYSYALGTAPRTPEFAEQRRADEQKLIAELKTAIGSERAAEFERARDYSYSSAVNIANRYNLPKDAAVQVWNVQKDVAQRAAAIRSDQTFAPAQRTEQLASLQQEATAKITTALGDRGLAAYKATGGTWLQMLAPPTR